MKYKAIIFDMDGTIVDSKLDFKQIKEEIKMPIDQGILEYIENLKDESEIIRANEIVHKHELKGANESEIMRDFLLFYKKLKSKKIPIALLTRNSKVVTKITLNKHNLEFDVVLTRDCAKAKPDPDGLYIICNQFNIKPSDALYIGDYLYDLQTAKNAGMDSGLIITEGNSEFEVKANIAFTNYSELIKKLNF